MKQPVPRLGVSLGLWTCGIRVEEAPAAQLHMETDEPFLHPKIHLTNSFINILLKTQEPPSDFGPCVCVCVYLVMEIHDVYDAVRQGGRLQRKSTALIGCCLRLRSLQQGVQASRT